MNDVVPPRIPTGRTRKPRLLIHLAIIFSIAVPVGAGAGPPSSAPPPLGSGGRLFVSHAKSMGVFVECENGFRWSEYGYLVLDRSKGLIENPRPPEYHVVNATGTDIGPAGRCRVLLAKLAPQVEDIQSDVSYPEGVTPERYGIWAKALWGTQFTTHTTVTLNAQNPYPEAKKREVPDGAFAWHPLSRLSYDTGIEIELLSVTYQGYFDAGTSRDIALSCEERSCAVEGHAWRNLLAVTATSQDEAAMCGTDDEGHIACAGDETATPGAFSAAAGARFTSFAAPTRDLVCGEGEGRVTCFVRSRGEWAEMHAEAVAPEHAGTTIRAVAGTWDAERHMYRVCGLVGGSLSCFESADVRAIRPVEVEAVFGKRVRKANKEGKIASFALMGARSCWVAEGVLSCEGVPGIGGIDSPPFQIDRLWLEPEFDTTTRYPKDRLVVQGGDGATLALDLDPDTGRVTSEHGWSRYFNYTAGAFGYSKLKSRDPRYRECRRIEGDIKSFLAGEARPAGVALDSGVACSLTARGASFCWDLEQRCEVGVSRVPIPLTRPTEPPVDSYPWGPR